MLADGLRNILEKAVDKDDIKAAEHLFIAQMKITATIPMDLLTVYEQINFTLLHHVAKKGSFEMFKLFFKYLISENVDSKYMDEKNPLTGCDFLNFVCGGCSYDVISHVLPPYAEKKSAVFFQASKSGTTCLHSIALNRSLTLVHFYCSHY